jgi:hypothetical protein
MSQGGQSSSNRQPMLCRGLSIFAISGHGWRAGEYPAWSLVWGRCLPGMASDGEGGYAAVCSLQRRRGCDTESPALLVALWPGHHRRAGRPGSVEGYRRHLCADVVARSERFW